MRTRTKTLAVLVAVASSALIAGAQEENQPKRSAPKPAEFKCPTCGSPCVRKAELIKQRRMRKRHARASQDAGQQMPPKEIRQKMRERAMQFDIDGDGELSPAERAALKAYRTARRERRGAPPASQPPSDE